MSLITSQHVERWLSLIRFYWPDWNGFDHPGFVEGEITYKRKAIEKTRDLLSRDELDRLLGQEAYEEIVKRLDTLGKSLNLLWFSVPRDGDLNILYQESLDKASFCRAIQDLLYGPGPSENRLGRYLAYVQGQGLPSKWTFPTFFLFLCCPDQEMFVKPSAIRWLFKFIGRPDAWQSKPNSETYALLKAVVAELKERMVEFGPKDIVDIQGLIWACFSAEKESTKAVPEGQAQPKVLAEPFSLIFQDWEEAEWAFELLRETLTHLGVQGPDDERFALTLRRRSRGVCILRLNFGPWMIIDFRGPGAAKRVVQLALLTDKATDYHDYKTDVFSNWGGAPDVSLYALPTEWLREPASKVLPLYWKTLDTITQSFGHYSATKYRRYNRDDLARVIFDPSLRARAFAEGVGDDETDGGEEQVDCYFTEETFDLLAQLSENPTNAFYQSRKAEFQQYLEEPFKELFADVARQLSPQIANLMETKKRLFGRIPKNDYGKGGAYDYYWGAFYPKGGKRTVNAQLLLGINKEYLKISFYIGEYGDDVRKRFGKNIQAQRSSIAAILCPKYRGEGLRFAEQDDPNYTCEAWLREPQPEPNVDLVIPTEELLSISKADLVERISETFALLFPLVLLATSDDPLPEIQRLLAEQDDEETLQPPLPEIQRLLAEQDDEEALQPPYTLEQCAQDTGFSVEALQGWLRALERKKQAILYGPPGTGKTYVAQRLARHLVGGSDGLIEVVQFHPAYAYEDFIQGIRPQPDENGSLLYPVVPGRFLQFCSQARTRKGLCVLIIDEINRTNLARVFGELMYLLEYRGEQVPLAAGGRPFSIPDNVRILGTMNTADRSIALVDHALRRRFAFIPLYPDYDILRKWHQQHTGLNVEGLIGVLKQVNSLIRDRNYAVGISFFFEEELQAHLPDIWKMEILPYLEEYFFDRPSAVEQFEWNKIAEKVLPTL